MSYTTDTLKEAGTTNPTRAHGYTPGFMNWVVLFIFFSFCFCFVCLRSVSCVQYCKKKSFNCDVQQFHQYQQNLQSPLTEQNKRPRHKTLEIQVRPGLGWLSLWIVYSWLSLLFSLPFIIHKNVISETSRRRMLYTRDILINDHQ